MKQCFGRLMKALAMRHGDREAIVNVERGRRLSYRDYHSLTNRIALAMRTTLEIGEGDKFLLILENDNMSLMQFPTLFKQPGTAAMTNLRDSVDEHRWQVELIRPKVAFIETRLLESHGTMLEEFGCTIVVMDAVSSGHRERFPRVCSFWEILDQTEDVESDVVLDQREHVVMLRFTGGTTGRGKCAMYTVDNWFAGCDSAFRHRDLEFDRETRMLHAAPLSHGTQIFFYPTFFSGGTNVTMNALDLEQFREVVESEKITHTFLVPTALYRWLELHRNRPRRVDSLRTLIYGAAPMSPTRLEELVECFGPIFAQAYAATEAPVLVSLLSKVDHRSDSEKSLKRLSSAGALTSGVEVYITDDAGVPVRIGERGEIRIRSRAVIPGYFGNPAATRSEFVDGAWRSGDLGYVDEDGFIYIVDRLKDMIISGGFNIYAVEVEAALSTHPAVFNVAVVGIPHDDWGEAVHAEVHLKPGAEVSADALIDHVKSRIGSYKAPKSMAFVDALPMSVVGKVLRRQVRDRYWVGRSRNVM